MSLVLAIFFYTVQPYLSGMEPLLGLAKYLAYINLALVLFNLIPGYPLDGGRVLRAIVWAITGNMRRATIIAAYAGRFFAFSFIFIGVLIMFGGDFGGGLWLAFIGWFLDNAASAQVQQVMFQGQLTGYRVSQAMSTHCSIIPSEMKLQELVNEHILGSGQRCFLVNHDDKTIGMMTLHRIKEVPRTEWEVTRADKIMLPVEQLKCIAPDVNGQSKLIQKWAFKIDPPSSRVVSVQDRPEQGGFIENEGGCFGHSSIEKTGGICKTDCPQITYQQKHGEKVSES